ncbi:MAG: alpha-galactosidase [Lachnospiraceae bacterium]|nr:alpha-galactosidase [Lachnospiraceae bacterium]
MNSKENQIAMINEYLLGDMRLCYLLNRENGCVGMLLLPTDLPLFNPVRHPDRIWKRAEVEPLVQLKLTGDIYGEAYAMGNTMRNSETVRNLTFRKQTGSLKNGVFEICTTLEDKRKHVITHHVLWKEGTPYIRIFCRFYNYSKEMCTLEMMESFSMGGLSPYLEGDGHGSLYVHRIRSVWSQEGRHETIAAEDLQLEPSWGYHAVRCERFGQAGSMPVNKYFPFAAVEDRENHVFWGAQIAHNASWQMELYRKDDGLALSGGLADRELGHWMKQVEPGAYFQTPEAIVTAAHTESFDIFTERLTRAALEGLEQVPETEKELPIIFNEYCTTWGNPSHDNIVKIAGCLKGRGFQYFVIDCGWYKEEGVPWDISMGDYEVSKSLFPRGLDQTVEAIRSAGMIPGIWFEIENVGRAARAYQQEEHLLHKDGQVLTSYFRRFWNLCDPWVEAYLTEKVIGTLKQYGFGYMKIDYNETIGIGCDGAESPGEGLRRNMEASKAFIEKVKREIPGIVLENCASGGHRLEPGLMSQVSMASFSDAHECEEIPIIAANLHRVIHPAQSQIWAVIRKDDTQKRIAYSITNTFLGRMCLSGDVTELTAEQWQLIENGMAFYRKIVPVIRNGQSYRFGPKIRSARHPEGWQGLLRIERETGKDAFVTIHTFDEPLPETIEIPLPENCPEQVEEIYSYKNENENVEIRNRILYYRPGENRKGIAIRLKRA